MTQRKYKVIQWATGNVGSRALRTAIEHPLLELVGLWVSSDAKAGKDAGELCGLPPVGIAATNSAADLIAMDADCVIYMRQGFDCDEACAILESGKNIVSSLADLNNPASLPDEVRTRLEAACQKGGTSLYSTGSSPGFSTEALAIPLLSMQRRLDCLTIDEYADVSSRNSPEMLFEIMGFGKPMRDYEQVRADSLKHHFGASMDLVAQEMGLGFEEVVASGEYAATTADVEIAAGTVPAGTIGAMRTTIEGMHGGKPVMRMRLNWYITTQIDKAGWDLRENGWRAVVEGDTPLKVDITYPVTAEEYPLFTPGLTAHRPVNAIPYVCEARPGMLTTMDLPHILPQFG
ncbi:MAG: dihydrodipicolinate reductase [Sphingomonadaceae bacterium]